MPTDLSRLESLARKAHNFTEEAQPSSDAQHPFDARNIHPDLPEDVRALFDNGHFSQATFEAFKFVDEEVQRITGEEDFGFSLMMKVFGGSSPRLPVNPGMTQSEKSEQDGFKFLFGGAIRGIRNPRGHVAGLRDDPDTSLDHLSFASLLLRKLDSVGVR